MHYAFRLKRGEVVTFNPEDSSLSILSANQTEEHLTLGRAESRLLSFLLSAPGQVKSRNEIVEHVWDDRVVASGSLNQAIFSLRAILNDSREHEILMTVPRRGYRFNRLYVIDHSGQGDDNQASYVHPAQADMTVFPPLPPEPLSAFGLRAALRRLRPRRNVLLGYAVILPLFMVAMLQAPHAEKSRIQITDLQHNRLTLHFMAASRDKALSLQNTVAQDLAKLPATIKGEAWLLHSKNTYAVSCIRGDGSTLNLKLEHNTVKPVEVLQQCLESAL